MKGDRFWYRGTVEKAPVGWRGYASIGCGPSKDSGLLSSWGWTQATAEARLRAKCERWLAREEGRRADTLKIRGERGH